MKCDILRGYLEFIGANIADSYAKNGKLRYVKTEHFSLHFFIFLWLIVLSLRPHYLRFPMAHMS